MPRWFAWLRARVGGYFWLPCPICGQMTAGHEWRRYDGHEDTIPNGDASANGSGICPCCTRAGKGCYAHARRGHSFHDCAHVRQGLAEWAPEVEL